MSVEDIEAERINAANIRHQMEIESNQSDPLFKTHGDSVTGNLNPLIFNNIISFQYFKEVVANKNFNEIINEIATNAHYAEPWAIGASGIPSTIFCCLYKLVLIKLTESQVQFMLNNTENTYVRCAGFLYVRYLSEPKKLYEILNPYLTDEHGRHLVLI